MSTDVDPAPLTAIEARFAIADVVHAYALAIRRDLPEDAAALFAKDGWFEIRHGHPSKAGHSLRARLEGRQGVLDFLLPNKGKPHPVPLIHNLMIEVTGETATASSVMEAQVLGTGHTVFGEYQDSFRKEQGQWRFASRIYTIFTTALPV
ncbi:MAG: nuclear transport factor 2 family protein [Novosphingobium sp.]